MLSHKQIWSAIDALAKRHGHSPSGLAKAAGLDPTTFNKSKRLGPQGRLRWPSTESLALILDATGASLDDFVALMSRGGLRGAKPLPLLKLKDAAKKKAFDGAGRPAGKGWGKFPFPDFDDPFAFALEITNDAAAPLVQIGSVIVVSPTAEAKRGDTVIVKGKGGCSVMRLVRQTPKRVELKSINPEMPDRVLERDDVDWVARVMWVRA